MAAESGISDLIQFLQLHPSATAALFGTHASVIAAAWAVAHFLNRRSIAQYKRELEFAKTSHEQELETLSKKHSEKAPIVDESFLMMNLDPIDIAPNIVPKSGYHYRDFHIIAHQSTSRTWIAKQITHEEVFADWFGDSLQRHEVLKEGYQLVAEAAERDCLLWSGTTIRAVQSNDIIRKMYPFVIVRLVPHQKGADPTTDELFGFIGWLRYWDRAMPNTRFTIQKMFRTKDKAYLRGYFEFDRLMVDGTLHEKYYLMRQVVVVKSDTYTHTIFTGLPNHELGDPYFKHLRDWWNVFRIIRD